MAHNVFTDEFELLITAIHIYYIISTVHQCPLQSSHDLCVTLEQAIELQLLRDKASSLLACRREEDHSGGIADGLAGAEELL